MTRYRYDSCLRIRLDKQENGSLEGTALKYQDLPLLVKELKDSGFIKFAILKEVDRITGESNALNFKISFSIE